MGCVPLQDKRSAFNTCNSFCFFSFYSSVACFCVGLFFLLSLLPHLLESVWIHRRCHTGTCGFEHSLKNPFKVGRNAWVWQNTTLHWAGNPPRRWQGRRWVEKGGRGGERRVSVTAAYRSPVWCLAISVCPARRRKRSEFALLPVTHPLNSETPRNSQSKAD